MRMIKAARPSPWMLCGEGDVQPDHQHLVLAHREWLLLWGSRMAGGGAGLSSSISCMLLISGAAGLGLQHPRKWGNTWVFFHLLVQSLCSPAAEGTAGHTRVWDGRA